MSNTLGTQDRRLEILKHLKETGRALVEDLSNRLQSTPQTIRKDLNALAEAGQVIRFHGGAALKGGTEYTSYDVRAEIAREEKETIGRRVASTVPNNASVILNAGTTTAAAARFLDHHVGLKVVTDSVRIANELRGNVGIEVMVPAGVVRASDGAILGESAVDFIRQFRADIAIIGAAAIGPDGALLDYDLQEAAIVRAIIESSRRIILAADSTKFRRLAPICFGKLANIDVLATDTGCPGALRALCDANGVELLMGN